MLCNTLCTNNIAIATHDAPRRDIPRHKLAIAIVRQVVLVNIQRSPRAAARRPKSLLAQPSHLLHQRHSLRSAETVKGDISTR